MNEYRVMRDVSGLLEGMASGGAAKGYRLPGTVVYRNGLKVISSTRRFCAYLLPYCCAGDRVRRTHSAGTGYGWRRRS